MSRGRGSRNRAKGSKTIMGTNQGNYVASDRRYYSSKRITREAREAEQEANAVIHIARQRKIAARKARRAQI